MDVAELGFRINASDADRATRSLDNLSRSARNTETATERMNRENEQAARRFKEMTGEGDRAVVMMKRMIGAAAAMFAGVKVTGLIKDMTMLNSRFEQMGNVMTVVGRNVGISEAQVNKYAKGVQSMGITMLESRNTIISMIQAQLDLSKASELARLAQDAAVIGNINSSEALGRLIYGLKSAQVEVLRTMGLNVNFEQGYKKLAEQIGKKTAELSEAEKAQARMNQVMAAGTQIAGAYEASMDSAGKQLGSTERYLEDLKVIQGEVFSEVTKTLVTEYANALRGLLENAQRLSDDGSLKRWGDEINGFVRESILEFKILVEYIGAFAAIITEGLGFGGLQKSKAILESLNETIADLKINDGLDRQTRETQRLEKAIDALLSDVDLFGFGMEKVAEVSEDAGKATDDQVKKLDKLIKKLEEQERQQKMTAREILQYELATNKATDAQTQHALATFDITKAYEKASDAVEAYFDLEDKRSTAKARTLEDTAREIEYLRLEISARGRGEMALKAVNRQIAIENALRSDAAQTILPEHRAEYEKMLGVLYDLEQQNELLKNEPFGEIWRSTIERTRGALADMFHDMLDKGKATFDNLLDLFKRMAAEMAATKIFLAVGIGGAASGAVAGGTGSGAGGLGNLLSLKNLTGLLDSTPLAGLGMALQDFSATSGFGGLFDVGTRLTDLSAMDLGLSALAGYAGNFLGGAMGEAIFGKEAESAWGATIGGVAGTLIGGPIGALFGSTIGGLLDVAFGGDGKKRSAIGVQTSPNWMGADTKYSPVQIEAESGLLLTAYAKRAGDQAGEIATAMTRAFAATDAALTGFFDALGVTVNLAGQSLQGINSEFGETDPGRATFFGAAGFNGELSADDLAGATDDFVRAWVDKVNELTGAGLDLEPIFALAQEGELLADTLIRVNAEFVAVNGALEALGMTAYDTSVAGMAMADGLAQAFGGLENMGSALAAYQQIAYTEEERLSTLRDQVAGAFDSLNMAMPDSVQGLRQIIEGLDRTTAEGQKTFAALVQLAPALDQVTQAAQAERDAAIAAAQDQLGMLEQVINEEKSRITEIHNARMSQLDAERDAILQGVADARANVDTVFEAFRRGIDQQRQAIEQQAQSQIDALNSQREGITATYDDIAARINAAMEPVRESVDRLRREADLLRNALGRLVSDNPAITLARQQAGIASIRGGATGDALERALTAATSATAEMFGSRVEYERAQGRAGMAIAGRLGPADAALSREESVLTSLEQQLATAAADRDAQMALLDEQVQAVVDHRDKAIAGLDQQLELAQAQIAAIDGTSTNVATLTDVTRAIATYEQAQEMSIYQIEAIDRARIEAEKQWITQMEYLSAEFSHNELMLENAIVQEANLRAIWSATNNVASTINSLRGAIMLAIDPGTDPGYAAGGIASGPTSGYTATLHGTEAIIPLGRGDIPVMVHGVNDGNQAVAAEIRALRTEVSDLKSELRQIRTNTGDSASYQRKWEYRGMPATRDDVA